MIAPLAGHIERAIRPEDRRATELDAHWPFAHGVLMALFGGLDRAEN